MDKVTLGRTDLDVSKLALGGLFVMKAFAELEESKKTVARAIELGVNYIDTAPGYGNSEEVLGKALEGIEAPVVLSTKLGGRPDPFEPQNRDALMQSVETSLKLLGRDCIDILMIHEPDRPGQYDWWTDMVNVEGPVLELMDDLKRQGIIRFTGLGGTTAYELAHLCRSGKFDVVLTAFNYSLLWQEAAIEILPAAREQNMGVVIGSPLQQGALAACHRETLDSPSAYWLSKPRKDQLRALYAYVDELGMSLPELALRFVISNPDVDCVLMGARSVDEVEQNVASVGRGALPAEVMARLDEIASMVPFRPFGEPFGLGWRIGAPGGYKGPGQA